MKRKNIVEKIELAKKIKVFSLQTKKNEKIKHSKKMKLGVIQIIRDIFQTPPIPLKTKRL